jgi:hypothetical protein
VGWWIVQGYFYRACSLLDSAGHDAMCALSQVN